MGLKMRFGFLLVFVLVLAFAAEDRVEAKKRPKREKKVRPNIISFPLISAGIYSIFMC